MDIYLAGLASSMYLESIYLDNASTWTTPRPGTGTKTPSMPRRPNIGPCCIAPGNC